MHNGDIYFSESTFENYIRVLFVENFIILTLLLHIHFYSSSSNKITLFLFFCSAPGCGDLRLTIEKIPATVKVLQPFSMVCRLHNCSDRSLDLVLTLDDKLQPNIVFCSTSGVQLGQLSPNTTTDFSLELLPLTPGLQSISGIRVTDTFLRRTYEHDDIAQVFVA
ncbi:hypothetical protein X798_01731 [Onchocerca flexuosa]|uniref:Trafficking protein particle complex subunit 13 C-terminal domain-containing protein n=1 Tax=Onchocerca flexuosa TaxID=387005 RepID=A0A238C2E6_9BILA|nr:hypothetical protein X798_01731 [Onchocerca flexuosa]